MIFGCLLKVYLGALIVWRLGGFALGAECIIYIYIYFFFFFYLKYFVREVCIVRCGPESVEVCD